MHVIRESIVMLYTCTLSNWHEDLFASFLQILLTGDKKSILNASFFSRLGLEAAVASIAVSAKKIHCGVKNGYQDWERNTNIFIRPCVTPSAQVEPSS